MEASNSPWRCVDVGICSDVGATVSARNMAASRKERLVTKDADKGVCAI